MYVMQDGRAFTNYKPSSELDSELKEKHGLKTDAEFKDFLNKNAEKLIEENKKILSSCHSPCKKYCNYCGNCHCKDE